MLVWISFFFPSDLDVDLQVSFYALEEMKLLILYPECSFTEVYKCFSNLQLYQNHLRDSVPLAMLLDERLYVPCGGVLPVQHLSQNVSWSAMGSLGNNIY